MQHNAFIFSAELQKLKKEYKNIIKIKKSEFEEKKTLEKCKQEKIKPWEMFSKPTSKVTPISLNTLFEHFQRLFSTTDTHDLTTNNTEDDNNEWYNQEITNQEITKAIKSLKNNKAPGADAIFNEHMTSYEFFQDWWHLYLNHIFNSNTIPDMYLEKLKPKNPV